MKHKALAVGLVLAGLAVYGQLGRNETAVSAYQPSEADVLNMSTIFKAGYEQANKDRAKHGEPLEAPKSDAEWRQQAIAVLQSAHGRATAPPTPRELAERRSKDIEIHDLASAASCVENAC